MEEACAYKERKDDWQYWLFGETFGCRNLSVPEKLNGHFLLIGKNISTNLWHVWTNRFGTMHAYYGYDGERGAIGSSFKAVAEAASLKELDWEAIAGFFSFGFFPQNSTYFKDIKILKPSSHYVFDESGKILKEERYWKWHHTPDPDRSYENTVKEFGKIFEEVLRDQTRSGRIAIPISGGLDSRSTVAAITNLTDITNPPAQLWAYSYGYSEDSVETKIAKQIAEAADFSFNKYTISSYLFSNINIVMDAVEGFQDITQCRQASVINEISLHADYLIAAHWGDVWMDAMLKEKTKIEDLKEEEILNLALQKIKKTGSEWLLENVCKPRLGNRKPDEFLRESVREELIKVKDIKDPDFRIKAFKAEQWSFRWTCTSLRMFQAAAFPRLPFYDNRIADFFCTVPTEFIRGRKLQVDYLKRFSPALASIRWQAHDADLYHYQHKHYWDLPKRLINKVWRVISKKRIFQRNWEVQFLAKAGHEGLKKWLLESNLQIHEFVPKSKIAVLLKDFWAAPSKDDAYAISMLLTFSAWLENNLQTQRP